MTIKCWTLLSIAIGVGLAAFQPVRAQDTIELVHRWEFEPALNAYRKPAEVGVHLLDVARLTSSTEDSCLAEARKLLQSVEVVSDEQQRVGVDVAMQRLRSKDGSRDVRLVMASLVIKYSSGDELDELWRLANDDAVTRFAVEQGLAGRAHSGPENLWLERLRDPSAFSLVEQHLAIRGLSAMHSEAALDSLLRLVVDDTLDYATRLLAARSFAAGGPAGKGQVEEIAERILKTGETGCELIAVELLMGEQSDRAENLIQQVRASSFAPAQVVAYRWLRKWRFNTAVALAAEMMQHPDSSVRLEVAQVLFDHNTPDSLKRLGELLADRNVSLRETVRDQLIKMGSQPERRPIVDEILTSYLNARDGFEGQEQTCLIIERLGAKEYVPQLISLLDHPRQEAAIRASWALQQLAEQPGDLTAIHKYCLTWTDRLEKADVAFPVNDDDVMRLSFLFQALGHNRYEAADEMLRKYVPKLSQKMRPNTRTAAIWALGEIWMGRTDTGLEQPLIERIMDMSIFDPEDEAVKYAAAITLGKFGNRESVPMLRGIPYSEETPVGMAAEWSLEQLK